MVMKDQLHSIKSLISSSKTKHKEQEKFLNSLNKTYPNDKTKTIVENLVKKFLNQENTSALTEIQASNSLSILVEKGEYEHFEILGVGSAGIVVGVVNIKCNRESALKISLCTNKSEILT